MIGFIRYCTVVACCVYPPGRPVRSRDLPVAQSRVRSLPGGSPTGLAESSSHTLRTGHSPQVAPHPSSRKRNYHFWIQAGNVSLMGTCTPLFKRLRRRTGADIPVCHFCLFLFVCGARVLTWQAGKPAPRLFQQPPVGLKSQHPKMRARKHHIAC